MRRAQAAIKKRYLNHMLGHEGGFAAEKFYDAIE